MHDDAAAFLQPAQRRVARVLRAMHDRAPGEMEEMLDAVGRLDDDRVGGPVGFVDCALERDGARDGDRLLDGTERCQAERQSDKKKNQRRDDLAVHGLLFGLTISSPFPDRC